MRLGWVAVLWLATAAGCSNLRVPAIDPSGERIFLPAPAYTTVTPPTGLQQLGIVPQPAFTTPPDPPPCTTSTVVVPPAAPGVGGWSPPMAAVAQPLALSGQSGQLLVAPARIVAPVNSEVILLGGLCGPGGYFVKRQPMQWMLSRDSVGHFVDTSHEEGCLHTLIPPHHSKLVSSDYAKTRSLAHGQLVTRGTPTFNDDVTVQPGQAWVSLTSPTSGTSYVTVLAPEAENWDQRRQTAIVHWVDAQWQLPGPVSAAGGQPQTLTTIVTRNDGTPIAGWLVRYEIVTPNVATFGPDNQTVIEIPTDSAGTAAATIQPLTAAAAVAQVRIQIIQPSVGGAAVRTTVGEGFTSVAWSAPGLAILMTGPDVAAADAIAVYRVEITNPGQVTAQEVTVSDVLPTGLERVESRPAAQVFGDRAEWRLGDLPPGGMQVIEIHCRPTVEGTISYAVRATSREGLQTEDAVQTRVFRSALQVEMEGPDTADIGQQVQFRIRVTNTGSERLENVVAVDRFDDGLQHADGELSPIQKQLEPLDPGQSTEFAITFVALRAGDWCHRLRLTTPEGQTIEREGCVRVNVPPAQPAVRIRKTGPQAGRVGQRLTYLLEVTNTGSAPLTNVQISDVYDPAMPPVQASQGYDRDQIAQGRVVWILDRLEPNVTAQRQIVCECTEPKAAAVNVAEVRTAEGVEDRAELNVQIQGAAGAATPETPDNDTGPQPPGPAASGLLKVSIADLVEPARVGESITYVIDIVNDRDVGDRNVTVQFQLPAGMEVESLSGPVQIQALSEDGLTVSVTPIAEMRARERLGQRAFQLKAVARQAGKFTVQVSVTSQRSPQAVEASEETTVVE